MKKVVEFLENKGHILMTSFIILQAIIFIAFTTLFFIINNNTPIGYNIFICGSVLIFLMFMIHFAYHSIKKAYFIELVLFLIMSTLSSIFLVSNFFTNILSKDDKTLYRVIGIFSIVVLIIGNLLYFVSAYFSYNYFRFKFIEKLGSRPLIHSIFTWIQFNNSMIKSDFGIILFFLMTSFLINNSNAILSILDSLVGVILFINIYMMRSALRNENKNKALIIIAVRFLIEGYKGYRVFYYVDTITVDEKTDIFRSCIITILISGILDELVLILIFVSTIMCIRNFGKGLKEILIKQVEANETKL